MVIPHCPYGKVNMSDTRVYIYISSGHLQSTDVISRLDIVIDLTRMWTYDAMTMVSRWLNHFVNMNCLEEWQAITCKRLSSEINVRFELHTHASLLTWSCKSGTPRHTDIHLCWTFRAIWHITHLSHLSVTKSYACNLS